MRAIDWCGEWERSATAPIDKIALMSPMTTSRRMLPISTVEFGIGWGADLSANAEQRAEGIERVEAPVKAKGKVAGKEQLDERLRRAIAAYKAGTAS